jgi:pyridoxal phosphate-dependent aminotransferase EpsN
MEPYQALEHDLAFWLGGVDAQRVVVCSSGTAALHLALEALEIPKGSNIAIPDYTMVACARAASLADLQPIFVDCGHGLLMDVLALDKAMECSRPVYSIMAVHTYGRRCNMDRIIERYGGVGQCKIIEDMAEVHGLLPHPHTSAACWSFYKNKIVAGEEGGAILFRDREAAGKARELRSLGFDASHDFYHRPRGHNYRLANCLATLISKSLTQFGYNLQQRQQLEAIYDAYCPLAYRMPPREVPWVYDIRMRDMTIDRQYELITRLNQGCIAARHGFKPMTHQLEYDACPIYTAGSSHLAALLSHEIIYLPISPGITTKDTIKQAFSIISGKE